MRARDSAASRGSPTAGISSLGVTSLSTPGSHLWIADLQTDRAWPLTRGADSELYPLGFSAGDQLVFTRGEPDYDLVRIPLMDRRPRNRSSQHARTSPTPRYRRMETCWHMSPTATGRMKSGDGRLTAQTIGP